MTKPKVWLTDPPKSESGSSRPKGNKCGNRCEHDWRPVYEGFHCDYCDSDAGLCERCAGPVEGWAELCEFCFEVEDLEPPMDGG